MTKGIPFSKDVIRKKRLKVEIWVFPKIGVSQNGRSMLENPIKMDDLGAKTHYFWKHPYRYIRYIPKKTTHMPLADAQILAGSNLEQLRQGEVPQNNVVLQKSQGFPLTVLDVLDFPCEIMGFQRPKLTQLVFSGGFRTNHQQYLQKLSFGKNRP